MSEVQSGLRIKPIFALIIFLIASAFTLAQVAAEVAPDELESARPAEITGDRIQPFIRAGTESSSAVQPSIAVPADYRIGPGDLLSVRVRGKVDLNYRFDRVVGQESVATRPPSLRPDDSYEVMPDGYVHLPLIGPVEANDKTTRELCEIVTSKLTSFFKDFTVDLSVARPGMIKVWVGGQVSRPGPQILPSTSTVLEALIAADILSTGSTRLIRLTRNGQTRIIDAYGIAVRGEAEQNLTLRASDHIYVPAVTDYVTVTGEVVRPERFEMVAPGASSPSGFRMRHLVSLCLGLLPTAAPSHLLIQRPTASGEVTALHVDLTNGDDPELRPGDRITVPSVTDYQPTVRLVGEFKGESVYQRVAGAVLNKTGVYRLSAGETAGDVIVRTGGTTPQADLRRARIERYQDGKMEVVPLDLEKVLTYRDRSADAVLESSDTIVLPAIVDKVYVFGQVASPGGIAYEPDRRLLDYLGNAGGPAARAKSSAVIIRGDPSKPEMVKVNIARGMKGRAEDNPLIQAGDVIYVPERIITDWRDIAQALTTIRLFMVF
ncbi:MAG: polysaccharide biosynthesis/export family protein [Armatimonadetes bacterium]|nr:polysaccharide biosynthesis/export family protein [Armatimonadota bacterium]